MSQPDTSNSAPLDADELVALKALLTEAGLSFMHAREGSIADVLRGHGEKALAGLNKLRARLASC